MQLSDSDSQLLEIQDLKLPWLEQNQVQVSVLRADLIDPLVSGNKYFKLKYNIADAVEQGEQTLLSFGGAWSNHLHALAAAGHQQGFNTIGIVRGEASQASNACLADAAAWGMHLHFVSREEYRHKNSPAFLQSLVERFGHFYLIPEGGANLAGIRGCQEMLAPKRASEFTHLMLACGTGTTMTGLITSVSTPVVGIQVLKGEGYLQSEINTQLQEHQLKALCAWQVLDDRHRGGYAKVDKCLADFLQRLEATCSIPFEPLYSGKALLACYELIKEGFFEPDARILLVHGGGMQGQRGMAERRVK